MKTYMVEGLYDYRESRKREGAPLTGHLVIAARVEAENKTDAIYEFMKVIKEKHKDITDIDIINTYDITGIIKEDTDGRVKD